MKPSIYDIIALLGVLIFSVGVWFKFGWEVCLIINGVVFAAIGIYGELNNDTEEDIQSTQNNT